MSLTRQAVLESINQVRAQGLVEAGDNLDHRRSPLITLTQLGSQKSAALDKRQIRWINGLAAGWITQTSLPRDCRMTSATC